MNAFDQPISNGELRNARLILEETEVRHALEELRDHAHGYVTKDSGVRASYESGMVRDTQDGKPRFDLLIPDGVPFPAQFLTRCADLMARGAVKYEDRNWEQANSVVELNRFKASAYRHLMQWITGDNDEDHAAAVVFNLLAWETTSYKMLQEYK